MKRRDAVKFLFNHEKKAPKSLHDCVVKLVCDACEFDLGDELKTSEELDKLP